MNRKLHMRPGLLLMLSAIALSVLSSALLTGCSSSDTAVAADATTSDSLLTEAADPSAGSSPGDPVETSGERFITVKSSEQVTAVPDIATVVYSVRTQNTEAAACQQQNGESVDQVIALLKEQGLAETSIQTSDYYMNPIYNYSGSTTRVTGYESTTTLTVSDIPIADLSEILAASVSTGINTVSSITYQASSYDENYQEALTKAVAAAYEKAQVLANAAGASVGAVINIQETGSYSEARYEDSALSSKLNSTSQTEALMDTAGEIMPGEIAVEASVTITYSLSK